MIFVKIIYLNPVKMLVLSDLLHSTQRMNWQMIY